jgi:hypothetical protein
MKSAGMVTIGYNDLSSQARPRGVTGVRHVIAAAQDDEHCLYGMEWRKNCVPTQRLASLIE